MASSSAASTPLAWIEKAQAQHIQAAQQLQSFAELFQKRLWHQLTVALEENIEQPAFQKDASLLPNLYTNFIKDFAHRMNPLKLAKIAVKVSKHYSNAPDASEPFLCTPSTLQKLSKFVAREAISGSIGGACTSLLHTFRLSAVEFLEGVSKQLEEAKQGRVDQPQLFLKLQIAQIKLQSEDAAGCKTIIEEGKDELDAMNDVSHLHLDRALKPVFQTTPGLLLTALKIKI